MRNGPFFIFGWLCVLGVASLAARAEIYRCSEAGETPRFTSDPSQCERAVLQASDDTRLQRVVPPAATPETIDDSPRVLGNLAKLFPPASSIGPDWDTVGEPTLVPSSEQRAQGLRESMARHYTRAVGPVSQVCTIELWSFDEPSQAAGAALGLLRPHWWGRSTGALLVLAHGVRLERNVGSRPELVPDCERLGETTRDGASRN